MDELRDVGRTPMARESSKTNMDTGKAVILKIIENVVAYLIMRKTPFEIPVPITVPDGYN